MAPCGTYSFLLTFAFGLGQHFILPVAATTPSHFRASRLLVVVEGSQGDEAAEQALKGFDLGLKKSSNENFKDQLDDMKFVFLDMAKDGLFEDSEAFLRPWIKRHLEVYAPSVLLTLGSKAGMLLDSIMAEKHRRNRPDWHYKCLQNRCNDIGSGIVDHETCFSFQPKPTDILLSIKRLKPTVHKVIVLSDGSALANDRVADLQSLSSGDRWLSCAGCSIEVQEVRSAAELKLLGLSHADRNSTFWYLPSAEGLEGSARDVAEAIQLNVQDAFVPLEVLKHGGLAGFSMHPGGGMEDCTFHMAQNGLEAPAYQALTTHSFRISLDMEWALKHRDIRPYSGSLLHGGSEQWTPLRRLWKSRPSHSSPKVLIVHSYGWTYALTTAEHMGFMNGLRGAGYSLTCYSKRFACNGDLEVHTLYWHTRFYFENEPDMKLHARYTMEYIKRWRPQAVYFTDDIVFTHLVIPCFLPLNLGPNPGYHECSGTQYVGAGINGDLRKVLENKCLEYDLDGNCRRGNFFLPDASEHLPDNPNCSLCAVGLEVLCDKCDYLYTKARPVNITVHQEVPEGTMVVQMMRKVKPSVRKVIIITDRSMAARGWKSMIVRQLKALQQEGLSNGISVNCADDCHEIDNQDEAWSILRKYHGKREYMVWVPSALAFLPIDEAPRQEFWRNFLLENTLGEVLQPGMTDGALLSAAGHPDSMGRVCAQYISNIVKGQSTAAELRILTTPTSKVFVNIGRALDLASWGIKPIHDSVLVEVERVFSLCPPGQFRQDRLCQNCPVGTWKPNRGDDPRGCIECGTATRTGMTFCPLPQVRSNLILIIFAGVVTGTLMGVALLFTISITNRNKADILWIVKESELSFGSPVEILGRGTFGWVVKAEYRGTMVAVKRVIPQNGKKFNWELQTMCFERGVFASGMHSGAGSETCKSKSCGAPTSDPDLEVGALARASTSTACPSTPCHRTRSFRNLTPSLPSGCEHMKLPPEHCICCVRQLQKHFMGTITVIPKFLRSWQQRRGLKNDFIQEMRVLARLRHPCVTTIMGAVLTNSAAEPMLIMELMEHGSLHDILHNETVMIENELVLPILCDVALGLRFLHAAKPAVIHGDLKAGNVLVDAKFRAKVSDFGLSQKQKVGAIGTPYWMAPELLRGGICTPQSDVYAFGILLTEVCTRKDPYPGEEAEVVLRRVVQEHKRPEIPEDCNSAVTVLMCECWQEDPDMRPTAEELSRRLRALSDAAPDMTPRVSTDKANSSLQKAYSHPFKKTKLAKGDIGQRTADELLYDVFPRHVADALRSGKKVEPETKEVVTIFFSDIVGFTDISSSIEPRKVSCMLDRLYTKFDALSADHGVFKVETIGDAYMAVSNLAEDQLHDHAKRIALFAMAAVQAANETMIDMDDPSRGYINIRVGFHSGPVVANVVGTRNLRYCLFGDTVNTASRMESNSVRDHIHCSTWAAQILRVQAPEITLFRRGLINVKGKGEMETWWVGQAPPSPEIQL